MKKAIATVVFGCLAPMAQAQSTLSLDDFNLNESTSSASTATATTQNKPASEMEACLLDQSECTNAEYRTTDSISLDDVVNLGIVDRNEVQEEQFHNSSVTTDDSG